MKNANGSTNGLEKYRKALLGKRAELRSGLRGKLETLAAGRPAAPEDQAPVFHDQSLAVQFNRMDCLQIKLIDAALDRMHSNNYGVCEDCGGAISNGRLDALPWAVRCIGCQERFSADSGGSRSARSIERGGLAA